MNILQWSEKMTAAAAKMLRIDGDAERVELRKCIDDWLEYVEPTLTKKEKALNATYLGIIYHPECRDMSDTAKENIMTMLKRLMDV